MISSILVNYRTPYDVQSFCEHYDGTNEDELFICNVEARPDDTEIAHIWQKKLPNVNVITFEANVGYAKAVNRAAMLSKGSTLAIFNADTELRPGVLQGCAERLWERDDWGVLGPLQVNRNGRCTHPGIFGTQASPEWRSRGWMNPVNPAWRFVDDTAVTVMGSCYFIKKSVWDELLLCPIYQRFCMDNNLICEGAFGPFPFYYEETLCSYHAAAHGYKIVFDGTHEMIHDHHGAVKAHDKEDWASRNFSASQKLFREFCDSHGIERD